MTALPSGIDAYYSNIRDLSEKVVINQRSLLTEVAGKMAAVVTAGRRIFIFGTGHSHMMAEEAFYRAGGMAAAVPVFYPALMLHEHAGLSGQLERSAGLAKPILERYAPQTGEMIFIFSNSGVNYLPVEMAQVSKEMGLLVVGVCSKAYSAVAPLSALGVRLEEVCDYTIDNYGLPGDAQVDLPGLDWRVGPVSTLMGALIWNCLLTETMFLVTEMGLTPPVIVSHNLPGAVEHNRDLLNYWRQHNPHL